MSNSSTSAPPPLKFDDGVPVFVAFKSVLGELPRPKPTINPPEWLSLSLAGSPTTYAPESLSLSNNSLSKSLSKLQASEEDTWLASARDSVSTPTPTAPTPTPVVEFSDVTNGSWASNLIEPLRKRNIVVGFPDGSFKPNRFATRGEFAAMLQKLFVKENSNSTVNFKDLTADYWAFDAIKQVSKTGILKGYPANDFRPDQPVTRAEVLVTLATVLNLKIPSTPAKTLQVYKDGDQVLDYAIAKVAAAQQAGLVTGYSKDQLLIPNKPATRAELVAMLSHALTISGKQQSGK